MLRLYNTLTKKKEDFIPIKAGHIGMYNCGPTVYDYAHIGNLRSYVFADIILRTFISLGYSVTQVINITDIGHLSSDADNGEDKMTKGLQREGKPLTLEAMKEMATFYTKKFCEDLKMLNISLPEYMPMASENIPEDIFLINELFKKDFVYITSDGIYFDTKKDPNYGILGGVNELKTQEEQSRIGLNSEKRSPRDFAVWKFNAELGFPSPWGKGFPGWHIECSAMSMKYLGQTFDIHTGGIDHIPVHHNNEIAQSECATGQPYVHYWLHNAFVTVPSGKMAKSEGNVYRLSDLPKHGISPLAYRYWLLTAHYSTTITFSFEALAAAEQAYQRLVAIFQQPGLLDPMSEQPTPAGNVKPALPDESFIQEFYNYIYDDFDTPKAIALMWQLLSNESISLPVKKASILECDSILGLNLAFLQPLAIPENIRPLMVQRQAARKEKNWPESDRLRQEIQKKGFDIKDTENGQALVPLKSTV